MSISLRNTSVLIVDDNPDTCDLLRTMLELSGASVFVARSIDDAVHTFRHRPAHVVITDIRLGDSDGYAFLEAIRKCNTEYKGFTPVIALTGYASPEDEERAIAAGFYAYIRKPFVAHEIVNAVAGALWGAVDRAA
jgi:CheY-like chemotaxis protein